jgi:hypothetical protein
MVTWDLYDVYLQRPQQQDAQICNRTFSLGSDSEKDAVEASVDAGESDSNLSRPAEDF